MAEVFKTTKRVEFRDTDAAGIMHFSTYFTYMEEAEHELLRSLGASVIQQTGDETLSWPRVAATAEYHGAVQFEDLIEIEVRIRRLGTRSVTYQHTFLLDAKPIASGTITAVCCCIDPEQALSSRDIPSQLRNQLSPYLDPTLAK